jgi:hypothetical protein
VQVWGRYLAYGCALGTNLYATAATGLTGGRPPEIGSVYGGQFRVVRVRYPRRLFGVGAELRLILALLAGTAVAFATREPSTVDTWVRAAAALPLGYVVIRSLADLLFPVRVRGLVVGRTDLGFRRHLVVIDTGREGTTRAWVAPAAIGDALVPNDVVEVRVRPWSARLLDSGDHNRKNTARPGAQPPGTITTTYDLQPSGPTRPKGVS